MYDMEKSSLKAAATRTTAASSTAPKAAIPARRAVSPKRMEPASRPNNARKPARKEYELRPSANRSAKLPMVDMTGISGIFLQRSGGYAIGRALGSALYFWPTSQLAN